MTQPAEHCGHQPDHTIGQLTECVLRPGHSGSHANHDGMRWWLASLPDETAQSRHTADHITDDALDALYARLANAELKAEAMTAAMQSTATDALKHRGCHMKLMAQCTRAERAEVALNAITTPEAIRAAAFAISDYALTHLGRDLGTIHIEPMAEAGIRAALDAHTTPTETR